MIAQNGLFRRMILGIVAAFCALLFVTVSSPANAATYKNFAAGKQVTDSSVVSTLTWSAHPQFRLGVGASLGRGSTQTTWYHIQMKDFSGRVVFTERWNFGWRQWTVGKNVAKVVITRDCRCNGGINFFYRY